MKKIFNLLFIIALTVNSFAQAPQKMSYQAVIRNSNNALVTSATVGMRLSILQGSATGTGVYVETQRPTTNANGLASIEIGSGTVVSGTFSTINWANGLYFIKTESDPTGGTNYTISGTSQLLSVPFALYAKTAEKIETYEYKICDGHYVGEQFGGGVIFAIENNGLHGLICSMYDLGFSQWSNVTTTQVDETSTWNGHTGANENSWNGLKNTNAIIAQSGHTNSAAQLCSSYTNSDYGTGIYSDWYLPSKDELILLCNARYYVEKANTNGYFMNEGGYWSSSEFSSDKAWAHYFGVGTQGWGDPKTSNYYVRAIRRF